MCGATWISIKDGSKTDQEKKAILAQISYKRYLMDYVGVNEEATGYFQRTSHPLFAAGIQCTQAGDTWALGEAGFDGLGLNGDIFPGIGRTAQQDSMPDSDPSRAWPDGNTSLVRLLVSKLIPNAIGPVIVTATLTVAQAILTESYISFLGYGIQPPVASWGNMLNNAQQYLGSAPWLAIVPGIA